jgi:hypothetical protein
MVQDTEGWIAASLRSQLMTAIRSGVLWMLNRINTYCDAATMRRAGVIAPYGYYMLLPYCGNRECV